MFSLGACGLICLMRLFQRELMNAVLGNCYRERCFSNQWFLPLKNTAKCSCSSPEHFKAISGKTLATVAEKSFI